MKKKLFVALCMLVSLSLAGCAGTNSSSDNSNKENTTTADSQSDVSEGSDDSNDSSDSDSEETTTVDEEALKKEQEEAAKKAAEECKLALESIEIEVLATYISDFKDASIVNLSDDEYEKATYITLGMKFPEDVYYEYKSFKIGGETATASNGEPASQTTYNTAWIDSEKSYLLAVVRVAGEVDVTKASVILTGDVSDVQVEKAFENSGEIVGFDNAKEAYKRDPEVYGTDSKIIKLKGRHYFIDNRYNSSSGGSSHKDGEYKYVSTLTRSYVLIPLEEGIGRSLTTEDATLVSEIEVEHTSAQILINDRGMIDATALKTQTTLNVEHSRGVVEEKNEDGKYDKEVYNKINDDIELLALNTYIEIDDGDGNIVRLKVMSED